MALSPVQAVFVLSVMLRNLELALLVSVCHICQVSHQFWVSESAFGVC